jgi:glycosyltransferase involved in cell wall biosynthesis
VRGRRAVRPASILGLRKVVVLTSSYPRYDGDFAGRFVADAVARLRARGLEVEVVCPERPADGGGLVRLLRRRPWLVVSLFLSLLLRLRRAARDAELVHAHWLASALVARFSGRPFVVTLHGTGSAGALSDVALAARVPWLVRLLLRPARCVICVSNPLAEMMRAIGVERVRWIPNGVAIPEVRGRVRIEPFVLYAGRLSAEKGIAELVQATRGLRLVVAGDGPLRKLVPVAAGFVPHDELERLYDRAAVVVFPSRQEGLPVALLEAMAHGCAIVASRVGGIPHLVQHGLTGLLVPPGEPEALRSAIETLLADAALGRRMGRAARARVQQLCSWERVIDATLDAYDGDGALFAGNPQPPLPRAAAIHASTAAAGAKITSSRA